MIWTRALAGACRAIDILQLFFAQTKGLKPFRRHLEGVHQHIPDQFGAPLAQDQIMVAPAGGFDMIDNQIAVGPQFRIGQCVGDAADRLVRGRPDQGQVLVEHDVETDLRQFSQLRRDRRPLLRLGVRPRLDAIGGLLLQGGQIDIELGLDGQFLDDLCARHAVCARPAAIGRANSAKAPSMRAMSRGLFPRIISDTPPR